MTVGDRSDRMGGAGHAMRVLSITKYIPYPEVTHAGGQYLWRHLQALDSFARPELLAPDTPVNREALGHGADFPARLMRGIGAGGTGRLKTLFDLESAWRGSSLPLPYRRLFRSDRGPWRELAAADLVEFQWSETIAVAPDVRRRLHGVPLVGVAHDVITQRWQRAAAAATNPVERAVFELAAVRSRDREARSFGALDLLVVFSEKDAALARGLAPETRVEVVHPGLGPTSPPVRSIDPAAPTVLFTGALNRADNALGAQWFLDRVWPAVAAAVPSARLVIAGAHPPAALARAVERAQRAELTGFVASLDPWYARASVFVAPLRTGAGVKFKTLDAMLRGVPTVSTSVGAEGIDEAAQFVMIADEPDDFARAVLAQLRAPDPARVERGRVWADGVYGVPAFQGRLRQLYTDVLSSR